MDTYLFCFGYEDPDERRSNERNGTDFESSMAVWVSAASEELAIQKGLEFANGWVNDLYVDAGEFADVEWRDSSFAYWIESKPYGKWPKSDLDLMPRI